MKTLFGYPNRSDDGTLSGGDWESTLPLTELQKPVLSDIARSTDATEANTQLENDLGQARWVRVVALLSHNLSPTATIRVRGTPDNTHERASDGTYRDEDGVMQTASSNVPRHWHYV